MKNSNCIPTGVLGDMGIALSRFKCGKMQLIFREKPTQDHGIDAEIEVLDGDRATGRLIAAQVKCGPSYFREVSDNSITFRFEEKHFQYWQQHSLPVIAILVDHELEVCYWAPISSIAAISTGKDYKIQIPKNQILEKSFRTKIVEIATPVLSASAFEIFDEEDVSTGAVRRVSFYIRLNAKEEGWTKYTIRQLILQMTSEARASTYFRNEISEQIHRGKPAQIAYVYVYQSEAHRNLGAYVARAVWIDPDLPEELRVSAFQGEMDESGLSIDWNENFGEIIKLVDMNRATKAQFLDYIQRNLQVTEYAIIKYQDLIREAHASQINFAECISDLSHIVDQWAPKVTPPVQCERASDRAAELVALLDNARIYALRLAKEQKRTNVVQFARYINDASTALNELKYEIKLVK